MREKDVISVIVPVYNVERYLKRCVESIINQTYKKLQIILVDDCSTDKSGEICEQLAEKDDRIVVFHKNWGLYNPYVRASLSNFQALGYV